MSGPSDSRPFEPDWTLRPGVLLRAVLQERRMYEWQLAEKAGLDRITIVNILDGANRITERTAGPIALATGTTARFWLNAQEQYENDLRRGARDASWDVATGNAGIPPSCLPGGGECGQDTARITENTTGEHDA